MVQGPGAYQQKIQERGKVTGLLVGRDDRHKTVSDRLGELHNHGLKVTLNG